MRFLTLLLLLIVQLTESSAQTKKWKPGIKGFSGQYVDYAPPKTRGTKSLPSSYSLKLFAPPIGDQDTFGTCVGWATTFAGLTMLENIRLGRKGVDVPASSCFSPQLTYDICKSKYDLLCDEGLYTIDALNTLKIIGATTLEKYPYQCSNIGNRTGVKRAFSDSADKTAITALLSDIKSYRLEGYIPIAGANVIENTKYYLSNNMPVVIGANMYSSIQQNKVSNVWSGAIDDYPGGHAMCVVGYDDGKEGGSFEIMNSWGTDWADGGYIWFRYTDFAKVVREAFALTGIDVGSSKNQQINNFDFTVSAVGSKTSRLLDIDDNEEIDDDEYFDYDEDFDYTKHDAYTINYPLEESGCQLNIVSNTNDSAFVYAFSISPKGYVSLITSPSDINNLLTKPGKGVFIPASQQTTIPLTAGTKIGILLSRQKLDEQYLTKALSKSYHSMKDFFTYNYPKRLAVNQLEHNQYFTGKLRIRNKFELNDLMPVYLNAKLEKVNTKLFEPVNMEGVDDFGIRLDINRVVNAFQKEPDQDSYELTIKSKKSGQVYEYSLICSDDSGMNDLFKTSFVSSKKEFQKNLKKILTDKLIGKNVNFLLKN